MSESLFDVKDKVVFVTGGSRGIGFMIAKAYVKAGAHVYICSRNSEVCDEAAAGLRKLGECASLPADLSQMSEIERVCLELQTRESGLDVLVNNAGTTWGSSLPSFPEKGWDKVISLNLKSPFFNNTKFSRNVGGQGDERRSDKSDKYRFSRWLANTSVG